MRRVRPAGPNRSRVLASFYRDERTADLPTYNNLFKMFLDHILRPAKMKEFEKFLKPHQLTKIAISYNQGLNTSDGWILDQVVFFFCVLLDLNYSFFDDLYLFIRRIHISKRLSSFETLKFVLNGCESSNNIYFHFVKNHQKVYLLCKKKERTRICHAPRWPSKTSLSTLITSSIVSTI